MLAMLVLIVQITVVITILKSYYVVFILQRCRHLVQSCKGVVTWCKGREPEGGSEALSDGDVVLLLMLLVMLWSLLLTMMSFV